MKHNKGGRRMEQYKYNKKFDNLEKLKQYLARIEKLEGAKIIKADDIGKTWVLLFNISE